MTSSVEIRPIIAEQTRPLRNAVLRPHQSPEELVFSGDDSPETLHLGAFLDGELVGIASVCREPLPGRASPTSWRLQGMAVVPQVQGQGCGRLILERCIRHVVERGGTELWCQGRSGVIGFYRSMGFETLGEEFQIEVTGPHYIMRREIS